ncbi:hypothetical protein VDG1235_329 [Verrucomicrobiia bacterium DG1235]|nr:hypothetical protein VDG1235_329 [Verrucomicrobiae bacterium DG1235]
MKHLRFAIPAILLSGTALLFAEPDKTELTQEAITIIREFASTLKPELKKALESGGPTVAIEVCSNKAPAIAQNLSDKTGWAVHRVSLKPRNAAAEPDEWETNALKALDKRQAANDGTDPLMISELSETEFRFMKAQIVEPLCTTCHGTDLAPEVAKALQTFYPEDKATGYSLGEIRGAISLRKSL